MNFYVGHPVDLAYKLDAIEATQREPVRSPNLRVGADQDYGKVLRKLENPAGEPQRAFAKHAVLGRDR